MKASIGLAVVLIPALIAASLLAYWVYIWTYQGVSLPPFKPLVARLAVSNTTTTSVNGNVTISVCAGSLINISLTVLYPYPWQLMGQVPYYYYYVGPYYSPTYYYYYSGKWYPTYQAYYYGYYYAFRAPSSIDFTYVIAVRSFSAGKGVSVAHLVTGTATLSLGSSKTFTITNYAISSAGHYDVAAFIWTGMINSAGSSWASLANPVSCNVVVR